jgi:hypothetical protein
LGIAITVALWISLPLLSGLAVYRTYMAGARAIQAERSAAR